MINAILSMVRAVCGTRRYDYLSGPITGGVRVRDAYDRTKDDPSARDGTGWFSQVKACNIEALLVRADAIRTDEGVVIIEPGSFEAGGLEGWGQREYLDLWEQVIAEHSQHVRFIEGWQYSSGCVVEFRCAKRHDRPTQDEEGNVISRAEATRLVDAAIADLETSRVPSPTYGDRLEHLVKRLKEDRALL